MLEDHARLREPYYQRYAVITMCCILHSLAHGVAVPKSVAVRWAQGALDERWRPLIEWYCSTRSEPEPGKLNEILEFIRSTLDRG
jgi:hypothetical protein